jgi:D-arabinonate dehydratase
VSEVIHKIDAWACRVALPAPVDLGSFSVTTRHYAALRIETSDGRRADLVSHTRGSPIDVAIVDLLAPHLIGRNPDDVSGRHADFRNATVALERDGVIGRAWSLIDIALHAIKACGASLPVWALLNGSARELTVLLVEGYPLSGESDAAFVDRLVARVEEGYKALKIAGGCYPDWRTLERRLRGIRSRAPRCRLVVDLSWSWSRAADHTELLAALGDLGVDWIEDAFPREATAEYARAAQLTRAPLGCGDEATRIADLLALVDTGALRVVRLDATALGGFTAVVPLAHRLVTSGLRVSFHENPEIHEHCALASRDVDHIEMFPSDMRFDVRGALTLGSAHERVRDGCLIPAAAPGLGVTLDLEQVARFAVRHGGVSA